MNEDPTFLLLINQEIPSFFQQEVSDFNNKIFYHIKTESNEMISLNFRDLSNIVKFKNQSVSILSQEKYNTSIERIKEIIGEATARNLLDGDCRIIALINSGGGHGGTAKNICEVINYLKSKGAQTHAYIFGEAASAAFMIAGSFDKKICIEQSEFMWHKSIIPDEFENVFTEEEEEIGIQLEKAQFKEYLDQFFQFHNDESRDEVQSLIEKCMQNIESDIYFSGEHLLRLGVVEDCPDSGNDLIEDFKSNLGIEINNENPFHETLNELELICEGKEGTGIFRQVLGILSINESPFFYRNNKI